MSHGVDSWGEKRKSAALRARGKLGKSALLSGNAEYGVSAGIALPHSTSN